MFILVSYDGHPTRLPERAYRGGYLRGRLGTQVGLRLVLGSRLPRQPAFSATRVHGCRLSNRGTGRGPVMPAALDPVRGK